VLNEAPRHKSCRRRRGWKYRQTHWTEMSGYSQAGPRDRSPRAGLALARCGGMATRLNKPAGNRTPVAQPLIMPYWMGYPGLNNSNLFFIFSCGVFYHKTWQDCFLAFFFCSSQSVQRNATALVLRNKGLSQTELLAVLTKVPNKQPVKSVLKINNFRWSCRLESSDPGSLCNHGCWNKSQQAWGTVLEADVFRSPFSAETDVERLVTIWNSESILKQSFETRGLYTMILREQSAHTHASTYLHTGNQLWPWRATTEFCIDWGLLCCAAVSSCRWLSAPLPTAQRRNV
jgi:hypothetical protein